MVRYFMTVKKIDKNEDYEKEMADWRERNRFSHCAQEEARPDPYREAKALEVMLTEDQFRAVQKAAIGAIL